MNNYLFYNLHLEFFSSFFVNISFKLVYIMNLVSILNKGKNLM